MTKKPLEINGKDDVLLNLLEKNVTDLLQRKQTKDNVRVQTIHAGLKLMEIRHKLGGGDEENFFSK